MSDYFEWLASRRRKIEAVELAFSKMGPENRSALYETVKAGNALLSSLDGAASNANQKAE